jgi:sporulation protein YlmC with PRC-barrel domain
MQDSIDRTHEQRVGATDGSIEANRQYETLGTVEELIIDDSKDEISYVILSANNQNYLVPWRAFDVKQAHVRSAAPGVRSEANRQDDAQGFDARDAGQNQAAQQGWLRRDASQKPELFLNLSKAQLQQAPTISSVSIQDIRSSQLQQKVNTFYSEHLKKQISQRQKEGFGSSWDDDRDPSHTQQRPDQQQAQQADPATGIDPLQRDSRDITASAKLFKASDIVGLGLQNASDVDLGSLEDLVVDTREGRIAYGLVSFGGVLNIGQKVAAVPWSSLTVNAERQHVQLDATEDQLNAAVLEDGNIDKLSQSQFAQKIHDNFNAEPYWGVYGYVPGRSDSDSESQQDQHQQQNDNQRQSQPNRY